MTDLAAGATHPKGEHPHKRIRLEPGFMTVALRHSTPRSLRNGTATAASLFPTAASWRLFGSGAQVITTDCYLKSLSPNKEFEIGFDRKYSQCNPVLITSSACQLVNKYVHS